MDDPAAPALEHEIQSLNARPHPPVHRRFLLKTLLASAIGGPLGYLSHPWLLGEKQDELAEHLQSWMRKLQEGSRQMRSQPRVATKTLPIRLDADGRDYETFLQQLRLRHIQPREILRPHFNARGDIANSLPPREYWKNIAPTLRLADELREQLGVRLHTILSAYRSPAYNAACPGAASHSFHLRNMALDLAFDCPPCEVVKAAEVLRSQGFFSGGIGRYPGFTHVDTRGQAADWG